MKLHEAARQSGLYGVATLARNATSFVMLPIYTRYLSPADYGVLELLGMLIDFASIVLGLRIGEALFRFYCTSPDPVMHRQVVSAALVLAAAFTGAGALLLGLGSRPISGMLFGLEDYWSYVVAFAVVLVLDAVSTVGMTYLRADRRAGLFVAFSLSKLFLQVSLNVYLVVLEGYGVAGVVYSTLIASGVMALCIAWTTVRRLGFAFSIPVSRQLVSFSVPIVGGALAAFYMTFGDRYFLRIHQGLDEVGLYALGYKFGFLLVALLWRPFQQYWDAERYSVMGRADGRQILSATFLLTSLVLISGALGLSLGAGHLLEVMSDPAFHPAARIVPVILLAYIVQCWTNYCRLGLLARSQTGRIAASGLAGVVTATAGYVLLIPPFGAMGAALTTLAAFLVRFLVEYFRSNALVDLGIPWIRVAGILVAAAATLAVGRIVPLNGWIALGSDGLMVLVFVLAVFSSPLVRPRERDYVLRLIRG